jgi:hypothetical protein
MLQDLLSTPFQKKIKGRVPAEEFIFQTLFKQAQLDSVIGRKVM